ncbi:hypothetical protein KR222_005929, partial [Zaprionus bogoriensis]
MHLGLWAVLQADGFRIPHFRTKRPRYHMRGAFVTPTAPVNYCQRGLCPDNIKHLACKNSFWGKDCKKPREGINKDIFKALIMDYHNKLRVRLSCSRPYLQFPMAKRLMTMMWDDHLSVLAMRVSNYCNDEPSIKCVNTPRYTNVGHNTGIVSYTKPVRMNVLLTDVVEKQWMQYAESVDESFVKSFPENPTMIQTQLGNIVLQENTSVGCGILK